MNVKATSPYPTFIQTSDVNTLKKPFFPTKLIVPPEEAAEIIDMSFVAKDKNDIEERTNFLMKVISNGILLSGIFAGSLTGLPGMENLLAQQSDPPAIFYVINEAKSAEAIKFPYGSEDKTKLGTKNANTVDPKAIHMNQFDGDPNGKNADCGPTSLAMALKAVGLTPRGANENSSVVDTIKYARRAMYTDKDGKSIDKERDGVDDRGNRVDGEHSTPTNLAAVQRGAENSFAKTTYISSDDIKQKDLPSGVTPQSRAIDIITSEVMAGHPVVLAGSGTIPSSSYKKGHILVVSGFDPNTGLYTVNDPTGTGPVRCTRNQLQTFAQRQGGIYGVVIENPNR